MSSEPPGSSETNSPILNGNQRRHFEVFLEMLQEAIDEVENLARKASERADALVSYENDLPSVFSAEIGPVLVSLRKEIHTMVKLLDIPTRHRSSARLVRALLTAELIRADDSYARKLRGYGTVDPRAGEEIDPIIDAIRADLVRLLRLADGHPPEAAASAGADSR